MSRFLLATALAIGALCNVTLVGVPSTTHAASVRIHTVVIQGYMFVPRQIVINVGDKVMWINKDGDQHTVTGNAAAQRLMRSRPLSSGARYTATFVHGGTFRYHCEFHPFMLGTVKVRAHLAS